jgi:hypothetical protein
MSPDDSFIIHIRSKDCEVLTAGYNSHLRVNLSAPINRAPEQMFHVALSSAEVPHSWYDISTATSTTQLYVDGVPSLVIPTEGNYDVWELEAAFNASVTFPYDCVYDSNSSKITFTNNDATEHTINFSQADSQGLAKIIGFDYIDVVVPSGGSVTGTAVVNLITIHSLFLHSTLSVSNVITTNAGNYESILDKIPVDAGIFDMIHYNFNLTAPFFSMLDDTVIRDFSISIRDQNSNLVQFNGAHFELSLLVELHTHTDKRVLEPKGAPVNYKRPPEEKPVADQFWVSNKRFGALAPNTSTPVAYPVAQQYSQPTQYVQPVPLIPAAPTPQPTTQPVSSTPASSVLSDALDMAKLLDSNP